MSCVKREEANEMVHGRHHGNKFGFLLAGLGIGAALSIFFAPRSGFETRKMIEGKALNAVDAANEKVRESRRQAREIVDRGQQKISELVAERREAMTKPTIAVS